MKIDHILLTTDLSPESLHPCKQVTELARATGARITLLHVVGDLPAIPYGAPLAPPQSSPGLDKAIEHARLALEDQRAALDSEVEIETAVVAGPKVFEAVAEYVEKHAIKLIALSTSGRTGFRHLALGSVAESILRHSKVPVLCFPQDQELTPPAPCTRRRLKVVRPGRPAEVPLSRAL